MHLGCWDDHTALADLIASARAGGTGTPPDVDAVNARVTAAHRDASREEVLAALRRNREATARYLAEEPAELDTAPTVSVVGRHPAAQRRPGPGLRARRPRPGPGVLRRPSPAPGRCCSPGSPRWPTSPAAWPPPCDITGGVTLATPDGGWAFAADPHGWTVRQVPAGDAQRPGRRGAGRAAARGGVGPDQSGSGRRAAAS